MKRLICWWFGCRKHDMDPAPPEYAECVRCGCIVPYADMAGGTRHRRFTSWCNWWLFRKWWPEKCGFCGKRFGNHYDCLPF